MKYLLFLLFLVQINNPTSCQWTVNYDYFKPQNIFNIEQEKMKKYTGYFFPEFLEGDTIITYTYNPLKVERNPKSDIKYIWTKQISSDLSIDSSFLTLKYFQSNVKKIEIFIGVGNSKIIRKLSLIKLNDGINLPIYSFISTWDTIKSENCIPKNVNSTDKFLSIIAYPIIAKKKINFAIADLRLVKMNQVKSEFNHPFFMSAKKESYIPHFKTNFTDEQSLLRNLSSTFWEPNSNPTLHFITDSQKTVNNVKDFFSAVFTKYPFYEERNIEKNKILAKYQKVLDNDTITIDQLWNEIAVIANSFKDPHFNISNSNQYQPRSKEAKMKIMGPIKLFEFYQNIYIAAIFDSTLRYKLTQGMKVLKIDNIDVNKYIDSLANNERGKYITRRSKAIDKALYRFPMDSASLNIQDSNSSKTVTIKYNHENIIPQEFRGIHCEFREYENGRIVYYRINQWDHESYFSFLNHINKLKKAFGIIIDLRNNPGGMDLEVKKFSSLFIETPKIYMHNEYFWNEDKTIRETQIVKPHRYFNLSHLKVTILANSRTACASEEFIDFMKKETGALLISDDVTAGTYANVYTLIFPGNRICKINCLDKIYPSSYKTIENKGIIPDIWVTLHDVNDLAPYRDKLLSTAMQYLKAYKGKTGKESVGN